MRCRKYMSHTVRVTNVTFAREDSMLPGFQLDLLLIYFVYGLAFFSMGLILLMEAERSPMLAEARTLRPLAFFGLSHGLHEWLEMFIFQAENLGAEIPAALEIIRLGLLVFSFLSLLAYGVQVLRLTNRGGLWDVWVGLAFLALYLVVLVYFSRTMTEFKSQVKFADALARYLLAVPGGVLAAAVLEQSRRRALRSGRDALAKGLGLTVFGMGGYAILQIFVPPMSFFPANVINAQTFQTYFGVPIQLLRAAMAILMTAGLLRATQAAEVERQRELFEAQKDRLDALQQVQQELMQRERMRRYLLRRIVVAQEEERSRIARELHDETAQVLTAFSLTFASLEPYIPDTPQTRPLIARIQTLAREMAERLQRLVHDLRPAQLDDFGLKPALQYLADVSREQLGLDVNLELPDECHRLSPLEEAVVYRVTQEALTNVARHAGTNKVHLTLRSDEMGVCVRIQDEGSGFDVQRTLSETSGVGLAGMQERVEAVGGTLQITSAPSAGTIIEVIIPLGANVPPQSSPLPLETDHPPGENHGAT